MCINERKLSAGQIPRNETSSNALIPKKDDKASKAQLEKETHALANSDNELFIIMSAALYNSMGKEEEAAKVIGSIAKRFPQGIQARKEAFEAFIDDESLQHSD